MATITTTSTVPQYVQTNEESDIPQDEKIMLKIMEQNLEGVMFHTYTVDLFCLLGLRGFKKMHQHQVKEEMCSLDKVKETYIHTYHKIPFLDGDSKNLWEESKDWVADMDNAEKSAIVRNSMESYAKWEVEVLEHLMKWKRNATDKKLIHCMIEDVLEEIKSIETIINILAEHEYSYEHVEHMSNYLCRLYK